MNYEFGRTGAFVAVVASSVTLLAAFVASSSASAGNPCGLISGKTFARIVGLPRSSADSEAFGHGTCDLEAWSGRKPRGKSLEASELNGKFADLEIRIEEDPNMSQAEWEKFYPPGATIVHDREFNALGLNPKPWTPPALGADAWGGETGAARSVRSIRVFWASTSKRTELRLDLIDANKHLAPVQADMVKAAMIAVPALGI